ncbi:MAG: DUF501 domain-containing protein, partial [Thermoleophilia bacterium]|nr:DUF501 domain-containing protein [Thermoleophilia bacterium]
MGKVFQSMRRPGVLDFRPLSQGQVLLHRVRVVGVDRGERLYLTAQMGEVASSFSVSSRDLAVVAGALGRAPYELTGIAVRCPFGYPAVVETPPLVGGVSPNPTLLYLVCLALVKTVSRAESQGAVRRFRRLVRSEPGVAGVLAEVDRLYRARRAALIGVAGGARA